MNQKQLTVLIALAALLGALGIALHRQNTAGWSSAGAGKDAGLLKDLPVNDVTQVNIKQKDAALSLVQKDGTWVVRERGDYPANFDQIRDTLQKLVELKTIQKPKVGATYLPQIQLVEPGKGEQAGTLVEFLGKDGKVIRTVLLGKQIMRSAGGNDSPFGGGGGSFPDSRFIMIAGQPDSVCVVGDALSSVDTKAQEWLSRDFIKLEKPAKISVSPTNAAGAWSLSRTNENGDWQLAGLKPEEKLDAAALGVMNTVLASASFTDVVTPAPAEAFTKAVSARIETFDGFVYEAKLAPKAESEDYFLKLEISANFAKERTPAADEKAEDKDKHDKEFKERQDKLAQKLKDEKKFENWTFVVSKWTVDALLKERKDLMQKPEDKSKLPPEGLPPGLLQGLPPGIGAPGGLPPN